MCGEVLTTLGLPSEWVWPWVLISDSKIRTNFSASMAASRSLVVRSRDAAELRFPAVFEDSLKWFRRPDEMFLRAPLRETRSHNRYGPD
jgi:hypothetical protein